MMLQDGIWNRYLHEVDEECLKRRNVPTECRVKEAVERQIQKEKATKEG